MTDETPGDRLAREAWDRQMKWDQDHAFDGCSHSCRNAGHHTRVFGQCEHAPIPDPPPPLLPTLITAADGYRSVVLRPITWEEVVSRLAPEAAGVLDKLLDLVPDLDRFRSYGAPGLDCPICLVDTGDSAHFVGCPIGERLNCATRESV